MPDRYAYFGPAGTFTEAALRTLPDVTDATPYASVPLALDAVRRGDADAAMVPLENSVEGPVPTTVDELADGTPLTITDEVVLPVEFALLARPGTAIEDIKRICTHPHAHAQVRRWLAGNLPRAEVFTGTSTAGAAQAVADATSGYDAAIAAPIAGDRYGLTALATGIEDRTGAVTRFVLVRRPAAPRPATGFDRTSMMVPLTDDHPGALLEILTEFTVRGINLTLIQSRPIGDRFGRYRFWIDCEGHVNDARVGEALMSLHRTRPGIRYLGSYPRADQTAPQIRPGTQDTAFTEAATWLKTLRTGP